MKYVVTLAPPLPAMLTSFREVEASSFDVERGVAVFYRETPMPGIVGTGVKKEAIAAFATFISVVEMK